MTTEAKKPAAKRPAHAETEPQEADARDAQIADLERQLKDANARLGGSSRGANAKPVLDLSGLTQAERAEEYSDWPQPAGDLPQPWESRALNLTNAERDHIDETEPGAPNTVSPIVISHGRPVLTYGASDPSVQELGRILGRLGFPNTVSRGANPFGAVDNSVMDAVHSFRAAYNVQEDPSGFGGDNPAGRKQAADHIGAWTWEAILRAGQHELQTA